MGYIKKLSWMDEKTKIATIEKIQAIKKFIGLPSWLLEKEDLDSYYGNVSI